MKKITVAFSVILMLTLSVETASAQYYFYDGKYYDNPLTFELGGSVGAMNCLTDIGGNKGIGKKFVKDLNLGKTKIAGSVFLSAMYEYMFAVRLEATFGSVSGDDKVLRKVAPSTSGRYERNLSFKSKITDFMLGLEIHPLYIINRYDQDEDKEPPLFSPYLLAGVGFFSFKPQAQLAGKWVDLQPLSTEGQGFAEYPDRKPYKLNQINIPLGLGVKYDLGSTLSLRAEFVYRKLNTDYLDDVSSKEYVDPTLYANYFTGAKLTNALLLNNRQYELDPGHISTTDERGNPKNKDAYFTFNLKIGYTFGRQKIGR
jgi:opacity protein-like surface antigen